MGPSLLPDELPGEIEAGPPWAMISSVVALPSSPAPSSFSSEDETNGYVGSRVPEVPSWGTDRREPVMGADATPMGFAGSTQVNPDQGWRPRCASALLRKGSRSIEVLAVVLITGLLLSLSPGGTVRAGGSETASMHQ